MIKRDIRFVAATGLALMVLFTDCVGGLAAQEVAKAYMVGRLDASNVNFFSKPREVRGEIFDKANFVYAIDAFSPSDKVLPINEDYLALVPPGSKTILSPGGDLTSALQIKVAQKKGYKVCLGPLKNLRDVVTALQVAPDYILLDKSLDKEKLRATILAQEKLEKNTFEPIDLAKTNTGDFVLNYSSAGTRAEGARLRILSYNLLASTWAFKPELTWRAPMVAKAIRHFKPDLIGVQEAERTWYDALEKRIAPYQFARQKDPSQQGNPSCNIIFNAERFRQLDGGILPFTDRWIRCLHWVLVEDIKTGERFVFANTHWDLTVPKRLDNAKMMSAYIKDLKAKYNVPVICGGDFNCDSESAELRELMTLAGLKDAVLEAPIKENPNISSWRCPTVSLTPYRNFKHIDHVLSSAELTPLAARLILDEQILKASDHLPLIVDLK